MRIVRAISYMEDIEARIETGSEDRLEFSSLKEEWFDEGSEVILYDDRGNQYRIRRIGTPNKTGEDYEHRNKS